MMSLDFKGNGTITDYYLYRIISLTIPLVVEPLLPFIRYYRDC